MAIESNYDTAIDPVLRGLASSLNMARSRHGKRKLGDEMADVIAAGVQQRTLAQQQQPDGEPLPANRGDYGKAKRRRNIKVGVGFYGDNAEKVGGEMLSFEQVRGQVAINETELVMTAGLDAEIQTIIDYFITGNPSNNQPPRPYYELDNEIESNLDDLCNETIEARIKDLGGN